MINERDNQYSGSDFTEPLRKTEESVDVEAKSCNLDGKRNPTIEGSGKKPLQNLRSAMELPRKRKKVDDDEQKADYGSSSGEEYVSYSSESCSESEGESMTEDNGPFLSQERPPPSSFMWRKMDITVPKGTFSNPPGLAEYDGPITPTTIFNLFFDAELIKMIVDMTNLYARRDKGDSKFVTTEFEIRRFIAILLLSGYNCLPRRHMYWETRSEVHNEYVADAMP